ncbi:CPBP family intramembrane metalloprotease [Mariniblastus sp.]|nr:CPBP family intramembrane metalloprotease [Mariniblastus sp.]
MTSTSDNGFQTELTRRIELMEKSDDGFDPGKSTSADKPLGDANPYRRFLPKESSPLANQEQESDPNEETLDPADIASPDEPEQVPPTFSAACTTLIFICWLVISAVIAIILYLQENQEVINQSPPSPRAELAIPISQGKILLGLKEVSNGLPDDRGGNQQDIQIPRLGNSVRSYQAHAVMMAEFVSPQEGMRTLAELEKEAEDEDFHFDQKQSQVTETLKKLFQGSSPTDLERDHLNNLESELPWFGRLAMHLEPDGQPIPRRPQPMRDAMVKEATPKFIAAGFLMLAAMAALGLGTIGAVVFFGFFISGRIILRLPTFTQQTTIYLETFSIWLVAFLSSQVLLGWLLQGSSPLSGLIMAFFFSLVLAMIWPVFRGVKIREVLTDIGYRGNPINEAFMGLWCYICSLPIVLAGAIVSLALAGAAATPDSTGLDRPTAAGHPIMEFVMDGDRTAIVMVFILTCVCAPIVEETLFRGFLYRSLRDSTFTKGRSTSVLFSAAMNSLVFAAIHPQGIFFIPVLGSLAFCFSLAREWRGSLWGPITMHALHNGMITSMAVFFFS